MAKTAHDGYSRVISGLGSHVIAPAENSKTFDPLKNFSHIASLGYPPTASAINADIGATDIKSFVALAGHNEDCLSYEPPGKGRHGY